MSVDYAGLDVEISEEVSELYREIEESIEGYDRGMEKKVKSVDSWTESSHREMIEERTELFKEYIEPAIDSYEELYSSINRDEISIADAILVLNANTNLSGEVFDLRYRMEKDSAERELKYEAFEDVYKEQKKVADRLSEGRDEIWSLLRERAGDLESEKDILRAAPLLDNSICQDQVIELVGPDEWNNRSLTTSPYKGIHSAIDSLEPEENDVVYDLGAGYGHFVLYGALTTEANYKGVEVEEELVEVAEDARERWDLDNAEFVNKDVLDYDFADGDMFYLFNPFPPRVLEEVGDELEEIAEEKEITIASLGPSNGFFESQDWLKLAEETVGSKYGVKIFQPVQYS